MQSTSKPLTQEQVMDTEPNKASVVGGQYYANSPQSVYYANIHPAFWLMNQTLLQEVLQQSGLDTPFQEQIMHIHTTRQKALFKTLETYTVNHFYSYLHLREMATQATTTFGLADCIIYPQLTLTREQVKRFFHDIAELLETQPNFHICLNQNMHILSHPLMQGWYLLNDVMFTFNYMNHTTYRCSLNKAFISAMRSIFQEKIFYAQPEEVDNHLIAQMLRGFK